MTANDMYDIAGEPRPKLCINCKHIGRNGSGDAIRYKCFAAPNIKTKRIDLVTGNSKTLFYFSTCYDARAEDVERPQNCGPEGKWFEPIPSQPAGFGCPPPNPRTGAIDLLAQLDKMK